MKAPPAQTAAGGAIRMRAQRSQAPCDRFTKKKGAEAPFFNRPSDQYPLLPPDGRI
jgi:hypothetical protein